MRKPTNNECQVLLLFSNFKGLKVKLQWSEEIQSDEHNRVRHPHLSVVAKEDQSCTACWLSAATKNTSLRLKTRVLCRLQRLEELSAKDTDSHQSFQKWNLFFKLIEIVDWWRETVPYWNSEVPQVSNFFSTFKNCLLHKVVWADDNSVDGYAMCWNDGIQRSRISIDRVNSPKLQKLCR